MDTSLLAQRWKQTIRSTYFKQGWGVKILIGFLILYFGGAFFALGLFLPEILEQEFPNAVLLTPVFVGFLLYYFLADLVMRFFLQDLSVITIQHYLTLPIKKSRVIHFLLRGSVFNFFNVLPLFVITPFAIRAVSEEYGAMNALLWFLSMLFFVVANHFLAIYVKRVLAVKQSVFIGLAVIVGGLYAGDVLNFYSLQEISEFLFIGFAQNSYLIVVPAVILSLFYLLNFNFLKTHTQLDLWQTKATEGSVNTERFSFLESKGIIGYMVANELKLITRNKRTRTILFTTVLFMAFGLNFYLNDDFGNSTAFLIMGGIFMTGIFLINYGQFLVGWEGSHFDGILTRSYSIEDFYRSKFLLLSVSCVVTYIMTTPYIYFGWEAFYINTACFIYNLGFNSFFLLYASTYNKKKIDLSKGSAFNYQGTGATQWIISLPLFVLPILIFVSFNVFGAKNLGIIAVGAVGLISMAFSKLWFKAIAQNFKEKKYRNAEGFREKS